MKDEEVIVAAGKSVSKSDLVERIAEETGVSKKDVKSVMDSLIKQVSTSLKEGNKVQLTGFGTFEVRDRKARTGVKPGTTEKVSIPASKHPAFKAGKGLKAQFHSPLNGPKPPSSDGRPSCAPEGIRV